MSRISSSILQRPLPLPVSMQKTFSKSTDILDRLSMNNTQDETVNYRLSRSPALQETGRVVI